MTSEDDFAPIWEGSILLEEHEAVQASVDVGGWLSAALDDPNVCEQMKADINRWFSAGFLYLDSVRQLMQADRKAVRAEQSAELAKFKALAETLATDLRECARALQSLHQIPGTGADGRLRQRIKEITDAAHAAVAQYKEARDDKEMA